MKNKIIFLVVLLFIIIPVSAETYAQNVVIDFKKTCTNSSNDICDTAAYCNVTIKYPNSTYIAENQAMSNNNNGIFNYTIAAVSTNKLGVHAWDMFCCDNGDCGESHGNYIITKTGVELSQEKAIIYMGMMALLIFMFVVNIGGIAMLPGSNTRDDDTQLLSISKLKYVRAILYITAWGILMAITFTASNISFLYLETTLMGDVFFTFYKLMGWLTLPGFVLWFIFIFVSIFNDKETKKMLERGVPM